MSFAVYYHEVVETTGLTSDRRQEESWGVVVSHQEIHPCDDRPYLETNYASEAFFGYYGRAHATTRLHQLREGEKDANKG